MQLPSLMKTNRYGKDAYVSYIVLVNGYQYIRTIYRGYFGTMVILVENVIIGSKAAIRIKPHIYNLRGDRFHWQIMDHPHLMCLLDNFHDDKFVFFVMDYMSHRDVITYLNKHNIHARKKECLMHHWTYQVLQGFVYLHKMGFALLNFTWHHVLLDDVLNAKIGNLSYVRSNQGSGPLKYGHTSFRAPETLYMSGLLRSNIDRVDMWALGASLLQILTKKCIAGHAFSSTSSQSDFRKTYSRILDNLLSLSKMLKRTRISEAAQDFLLQILRLKPELRLSSEEARQHVWFGDDTVDYEMPSTKSSEEESTSSSQQLSAAVEQITKKTKDVCDFIHQQEHKRVAFTTPVVPCPEKVEICEMAGDDEDKEEKEKQREDITTSDSLDELHTEFESVASRDFPKTEDSSVRQTAPILHARPHTLSPTVPESSRTTVDSEAEANVRAVQEGMAHARMNFALGQQGDRNE